LGVKADLIFISSSVIQFNNLASETFLLSCIKLFIEAPVLNSIFFDTTNAVEGYHRQVRKVTKTKGAFTNDMALLKLVYLATINIQKKWTSPLHNWSSTIQQLYIIFEGRIDLDIGRTQPPRVADARSHSKINRKQVSNDFGMDKK